MCVLVLYTYRGALNLRGWGLPGAAGSSGLKSLSAALRGSPVVATDSPWRDPVSGTGTENFRQWEFLCLCARFVYLQGDPKSERIGSPRGWVCGAPWPKAPRYIRTPGLARGVHFLSVGGRFQRSVTCLLPVYHLFALPAAPLLLPQCTLTPARGLVFGYL